MFDHFQDFITPILEIFGHSPTVQAAVIVALSFIIASIFKYVIVVGFKKLSARSSFTVGNDIIDLLQTPIYYSVLFLGLFSAILLLNPSQTYLYIESSILKSVALIVWTIFLLKLTNATLKRLSTHPTRFNTVNSKTLPLFQNLFNIVIIVLSVYLIFSSWEVDMTAWLASAGIVGIAVGFAAKDTLANLFSGVFIMADAPYKVGDYVVLDSGERGEITHIGIRSTRMLTRDDIEITIPNSVMGNSKIINESGGPHEKTRCRVPIGVSYNSDIDLVRSVLMQIANAEELVCSEPEARVRFRKFSGSELSFDLLVWIDKPALRGLIVDNLNCQIFKQFQANNIEIPYSKHDLYIKEMPYSK